jgi:putative glycosyltransferase (TIGR04372 family)
MSCPIAYAEVGMKEMEKGGLNPAGWFIVLHVRQAGLSRASSYSRNADISSYEKAINAVIKMGGQVVRVGSGNMPRLKPRKGLLDYAHEKHQLSEANVFFMAKARLMLATASGASAMATSFGTPLMITNATHVLLQPSYANTIMLPQLFICETNGVRPFSEVFCEEIRPWLTSKQKNRQLHHSLRENSADEIRSATLDALTSVSSEQGLTGVPWNLSLYPEAKSFPPPIESNFATKWSHAFL